MHHLAGEAEDNATVKPSYLMIPISPDFIMMISLFPQVSLAHFLGPDGVGW